MPSPNKQTNAFEGIIEKSPFQIKIDSVYYEESLSKLIRRNNVIINFLTVSYQNHSVS